MTTYSFSIIELVILILWLFSALFDYIKFSYIWQLKEYRLDRFRDFITSNRGKDFLLSYPLVWRTIIGLLLLLVPYPDLIFLKYALVVFLGWELLYNCYHLINKGLARPTPTKKIILLILTAIAFEVAVIWFTQSWYSIIWILIFRFLTVSSVVGILYIPTNIAKSIYIRKATSKMEKFNDLTVIGITGSYGKTTVKNYLSEILSCKYSVIKTPKNINTPIGVSQHILSSDFQDKDIYVVEMGAYRRGEIKEICDIVNPRIGILTAIDKEHLSLFGSVEAIQKTKYELLRSIPDNGLVITNADNKYCTEFLGELSAEVKTFGIDEENEPDFLVKDIESSHNQLSFKANIGGEEVNFKASVIGGHNAENIAAATLAANFLDVSIEDIKDECLSLETPERRLTIRDYGRARIIDDSYNSNPKGFKAALNVLSTFSSDKKHIVITRGMLELGEESFEAHKRIGEEISFYADELVIISKDSEKALKAGILEKYRTKVKTIFDIDDLLEYVRSLYDTNSVILIENRLPPKVYEEILGDDEN
ncbi:MAG: UDP-N-acetylmuramoyl-tripeptide--D-alanyl-D-alanine ligase [Candidatus Magasanikbacteria bacterium]